MLSLAHSEVSRIRVGQTSAKSAELYESCVIRKHLQSPLCYIHVLCGCYGKRFEAAVESSIRMLQG